MGYSVLTKYTCVHFSTVLVYGKKYLTYFIFFFFFKWVFIPKD